MTINSIKEKITMNKYYIRDNEWVEENVPSTKQIEDIPTNKEIELYYTGEACMICDKFVSSYVSILRLDWIVRDIYDSAGYCCYPCADRHTLNKERYYMNQDGTRYTPDLMSVGNVPVDMWGNVSDSTKNRIDEINKHRLQAKKYVERMKKYGILAKHKKIRVRTTTGATTLAGKMIEWNKNKDWAMAMKVLDEMNKNG
tara:strand:- start:19 stop:615 length:597 start_codon:yes stop_codon:yes gene_type:complete